MPLNELSYTYALNEALDLDDTTSSDYLGSFSPFILNYFKKHSRGYDKSEIQDGIIQEYRFNLPLHIISSLLDRLKEEGYLLKDGDKYKRTQKLRDCECEFEDSQIVKAKMLRLIRDLNRYLNSKLKEPISN